MKFMTLEGGKTTKTDPKRGIWYSARCHYWTDNWSLLKKVGPGIPVCPRCGSVGCLSTFTDYMTSACTFEAGEERPGYASFLLMTKEICHANTMGMYEAWRKEHGF